MWMGVPVVTLAGTLPHARVGVSLLSNAGLPELIACDLDDYVAIASRLAGEPARRRELRKTLRQQMERSPLMDGARAAREIERVIRQRWGAWCGGELRA
jgi:predicted O-linked N-acetylglucosamine transferase (SPINDLY family)